MTTTSDPALLDTNVLVYALFPAVPEHAASRALVDTAKTAGVNLCVAPQNLVEFYAGVTDAKRVTQPKTVDETLQAIDDILALPGLRLLPVPVDVIARWQGLRRQSPVTKKRAFDAQLVAAMLGNGVMKIHTFNAGDFQQFAFAGAEAIGSGEKSGLGLPGFLGDRSCECRWTISGLPRLARAIGKAWRAMTGCDSARTAKNTFTISPR